jgi:hypothetical protein
LALQYFLREHNLRVDEERDRVLAAVGARAVITGATAGSGSPCKALPEFM